LEKTCARVWRSRKSDKKRSMKTLANLAWKTQRLTGFGTTTSQLLSKNSSPIRKGHLVHQERTFVITAMRGDPFRPAKRVAGQRKDVWCARECCILYSPQADALSRSIVNEAASESKIEGGMVNMGQGFFGYNRKKYSMSIIT
jgi:hypothetical protein